MRVTLQLQHFFDDGFVPSCMAIRRTVLLQKDWSKSNIASNYSPITYLPLVWKLMTGIISNKIYGYLDQQYLAPEEQKRC